MGMKPIYIWVGQCQNIGTGAREIRYSRIDPTVQYVSSWYLVDYSENLESSHTKGRAK